VTASLARRRLALACALAMGVAAGACRKADPPSGAFRLAFFPNLSHAQALVGNGSRRRSAAP
jgi:hypothetical protein